MKIKILQILLAVQLLLLTVIANKSSVHDDVEVNENEAVSVRTEVHSWLEEFTAQDYCTSDVNYFSCVKADKFICVRVGMCMTGPSRQRENSSIEPKVVAGLCPYFPHRSSLCSRPFYGYYRVPLNMSVFELINYTCSYYNRQGPMCSQCKDGYGPAVYAFSLMCAKCTDNGIGWVLYFALTLLPITVFYFVVVMFNVRVTSPPLTGFVFMCQTSIFIERLYVDLDMKIDIASRMYAGGNEKILSFLVHSVRLLCGFWNLDFFRYIIPPFCVSSHLSNVQALFLEYVYVFYPLFLIIFSSICIELHDRNFKPLNLAWKPFHKIFVRLQNTWDPTASIIHSFSTFMLLYTSKLLFVGSNTIFQTKLYHIKPLSHFETNEHRQYFDYSVPVNSKHYVIYVSCSTVILVVFFVCPTLMLCLYPFKIFRLCIHHCLPLKWQLILCTFIDTFQGHYKDGTNGTRDCRFFSAIHWILLCLIVIFRMYERTVLYATLPAQFICIVGSLLFALVRPCKKKYANVIQSLLFALTALNLLVLFPSISSRSATYLSLLFILMCMLIPHIIFGGCIIHRIIQKANTRFGLSIKILKYLRKSPTVEAYSAVNDTDMITVSTALLREHLN